MNEIKISNINPNSVIINFVEKAIADSKKGNKNLENVWLNFGNVPQNAIDYVNDKFKINLTGYKYVLEASYVVHTLSRHGEGSNDRSPVSAFDFCAIPLIISEFDKVELGLQKNNNLKTLLFKKKINNQWYCAMATEVRTGKKSVAFNTLYKREARK